MEFGLHRLICEDLDAYVEESRQFYDLRRSAAKDAPQPDLRDPAVLKDIRSERSSSTSPNRALEHVAQAYGREVPVRVITPQKDEIRGVYLDIHGGGFYMDSAARNDFRNARLADTTGVAVVSVDYRLAPESPWPAAPDDCETAALWALDQAQQKFGTSRVVIGGASAGSNLAMSTLMRLRDRGLTGSITGAVLEFGAYDLSGQTPGGRLYAGEYFIEAYTGHAIDRTDPDISPLFGRLHGLPPTLLIVGILDILLEDNFAMAARLSVAGNDVEIRVYPESPHGFTFHPTSMARAATRGIESWVRDRLEGK
ncbi:MAG: alpha/beta hydrolase [Actinomycetota bacterium]|nr:MAG: alpha/beta hydrolase [Actinomycetota bacterium]